MAKKPPEITNRDLVGYVLKIVIGAALLLGLFIVIQEKLTPVVGDLFAMLIAMGLIFIPGIVIFLIDYAS